MDRKSVQSTIHEKQKELVSSHIVAIMQEAISGGAWCLLLFLVVENGMKQELYSTYPAFLAYQCTNYDFWLLGHAGAREVRAAQTFYTTEIFQSVNDPAGNQTSIDLTD